MSSSDRRQVLSKLGGALLLGVAAPGLLGGCFRPMLADDGPAGALIGRIRFPEFDDRVGYYLNESLRDRLGRTEVDDFALDIKTQLEESGRAIAQDNAVTRISVTATAKWVLYRKGEAKPLLEDQSVSRSGYNSTASLFATRAAKLDIERRLARDLGERISRSVLAQAQRVAAASPGT